MSACSHRGSVVLDPLGSFLIVGIAIDGAAQSHLYNDEGGDDANDLNEPSIQEGVGSGVVLEGEIEGHIDRVDEARFNKHGDSHAITLQESFINNAFGGSCEVPNPSSSESSKDNVQCECHREEHP